MSSQWTNIQHVSDGTALLIVKNEIRKEVYFADIGATGWAIVQNQLHVVKRIFVNESDVPINEMVVDLNDPLEFESDTAEAILMECLYQKNMPFLHQVQRIMQSNTFLS